MQHLTRAVAIAGALALVFTACGTDKTDNASTTSTTHGPRAYVDSGNFVTGLHLAKITKFDRVTRDITYDAVQLLTGEAAIQAYEQDHGEALDTDYYIRNQSKATRPAALSDDAKFRVNTLGGFEPSDPDKGHKVNFDTFSAYFDGEQAPNTYFWISLKDAKATDVEEQYFP